MMSAPLAHLDSWANALTGFGTSRDRTTQSVFIPDFPLWPIQLAPIYNGSSTARKIVALPVEEAWREGVEVKCDDPAWAERIHRRAVAMGMFKAFFDAQVFGRLFGGTLIWAGVNDGRDPSEPLDWAKAKSLEFLEVFDPRFAMPKGPHMLYPESWLLWGIEGGSAEVHHTRMIRFGGAHTDDLTRRGNRGWDYSILQALLPDIQAFDEAFHSAGIMLSDASQAVIKLKGLISGLAGKQSDLLKTRAMLLDMSRSVARALFLDKEEEFTKVATQFSGTSDVVMLFGKKLAAATGIPVAVLLGESPAGLQATGAIDIRIFYDKVAAERKRVVEPPLLMLLNLLAKSMGYNGEVKIEWPSMWQMSPKEEADYRLSVAQGDKIYEEMGAATPQQIWKDRWGKGEYSADNVYNPNDAPTWAALPRATTLDPEGGKPAQAPATPKKDHLTGDPKKDIPTEIAAGKPQDQAVAIALHEQDK
jgi:phage-related protein (TIGR01555 family)